MDLDFRAIAKDLISTLLTVAVIIGVGIAITGTWPFMVAVQSGSMEPHLHIGDVVILVSPSRTKIITWVEGHRLHYRMFGDYGDVIVYYPNGDRRITPIIHRVIAWVNKGDRIPILDHRTGKLILSNVVAPSSGYITQGDHNPIPDQLAELPNGERILPVKRSWIVGVAKFRIPYIGYLRLLLQKL